MSTPPTPASAHNTTPTPPATDGRYRVGVVGLGVMGQRMLARLADHPRLQATWVWDADPQAIARTLQAHPGLQAAASAQALIAQAGLHTLYIATPPAAHMALSHQAFDAGLAVLCEKPLTVDFDAARVAIARIQAQGLRAAVNFSLASSPGLAALQQAWAEQPGGLLGQAQSAQVELAFAAWPRPWQAAAGAWLSQRAEGGFTREVLSHFIFVLQRVLGPLAVLQAQPVYPDDGVGAETRLTARLLARPTHPPGLGELPVTVDARLGGALDDHNRLLLTGSQGEVELREWFGLQFRRSDGQAPPPAAEDATQDAATARLRGQADQLLQWVALIEGRPHSLPGYAEALAVQQTIEALLSGR